MKSFFKRIILKLFKLGYALYWEDTYARFRAKYTLAPSFRFNGEHILLHGEGQIEIGAGTYVGHNTFIQAKESTRVVIGKGCSISHNVKIYTSTDDADQDFSLPDRITKIADVVIGDYVWIGANVFISPGVTIASNSIVGANSVVTKDVKQFEIVGGVPARLIRMKRTVK